MLTVPHLKPGQTPYDPSLHTLTSPTNDSSLPTPSSSQPSPTSILNHAIVKDALTSLHQEDNDHFATLQTHSALQLCTMEKDHKAFLEKQKHKYLDSLPSPSLKQLFLSGTQPYFTWSTQRVTSLYNAKVHSYRHEVIERQNEEFITLALQPENAFNDVLQTTYRDMILFNLDTLYESLPKKDRKRHFDQASRTFYNKVIEKRLELDPTRLDSVLSAPVIKRTLSSEEIAKYQNLAENAIRQDTWKQQAQTWLDNNTDSKTVQRTIASTTKTKEETTEFQYIYDALLNNKNRKQCLSAILNTMNVWNLVMENGAKPESIPSWVSRVNPDLRDYILKALVIREQHGGLCRNIDYMYILDFIENFDISKVLSTFADESRLYSFMERAGGVQSEVFGIILRVILGSLGEEDGRWIDDLMLARNVMVELGNGGFSRREGNDFLGRFDIVRQTRLANQDGRIIDELEIRSILAEMLQYTTKAAKQ